MVFIQEVNTQTLLGCSEIVSMWLFKQEDDGQGAARCPLKTFRVAPELPWVSSFQRVPESLIL